MLEIKRRIGQSFVIDRRITVTVVAFAGTHVGRVTLAVDRGENHTRSLLIPLGDSAVIQTLAGAIRIHARWIARREIALGIEAPLHIQIERPERVQPARIGQKPHTV